MPSGRHPPIAPTIPKHERVPSVHEPEGHSASCEENCWRKANNSCASWGPLSNHELYFLDAGHLLSFITQHPTCKYVAEAFSRASSQIDDLLALEKRDGPDPSYSWSVMQRELATMEEEHRAWRKLQEDVDELYAIDRVERASGC